MKEKETANQINPLPINVDIYIPNIVTKLFDIESL